MKTLTFVYSAKCKSCIDYKAQLQVMSSKDCFDLRCYDIDAEPIDTILFMLSLYESGHAITRLPFVYDGQDVYEDLAIVLQS